MGSLFEYGSYGYNAYEIRVAQTTANVIAGAVTQKVIEVPVNHAVDRFLDGHRRALSDKQSSYLTVPQPSTDTSEPPARPGLII